MATTQKQRDAVMREYYVKAFMESAAKIPVDDVTRTGSGTFAFPIVDPEGYERFIEITVKVPIGERGGEPYDGYAEGKAYENDIAKKASAAEEAKIAKDKKIAKDAADRARKKAEKDAQAEKGE